MGLQLLFNLTLTITVQKVVLPATKRISEVNNFFNRQESEPESERSFTQSLI